VTSELTQDQLEQLRIRRVELIMRESTGLVPGTAR
jgi:hypothetical protein